MINFDDIGNFINNRPGRLFNKEHLSVNRPTRIRVASIAGTPGISIVQRICITVFMFLPIGYFSVAQEQMRHYDIIYKGDTVGRMNFYESRSGDNLSLKFHSRVRIRSLISFLVETEERSEFKNGALVHSSVRRKINGKERTLKQTIAAEGAYRCYPQKTSCGGAIQPIAYNLHLLYISEPADKQKVYSDHFQQYLVAHKIADHKYRVELPDGNYNYYSFENGICHNIEVVHDFFSLKMQLKK